MLSQFTREMLGCFNMGRALTLPGTCKPGPTALLPMGLAYVTTAYTYGRPMQARTNNVSITVYYENGSSNLTAEGYCPHLHLSLPRWQGIFARRSGVLATLVSFLSLVWQ